MILDCAYDFFHLTDSKKITDIIKVLIEKNPLLRSVIVNINGNFFVREYDTFSNIRVPLLDISGHTTACREEIIAGIDLYLQEPFEVLDNVLYRAVLLKLEHTRYKLIFAFNHLIFDGLSISILQKQLDQLSRGIEEVQEEKNSIIHYCHYIEFMNARNYEDIPLEKHIDLHDYARSVEESTKHYTVRNMKAENFELDISSLNIKFKDYYNEIVLLVFAKTISHFFGIDRLPITTVSHGRIYKGGNFNHIIGDFHDMVPVLFYLEKSRDPGEIIDGLIQYRLFIKENNLNFINYAFKGHINDIDKTKLFSPFSINSVIGPYNELKNMLIKMLEQRAKTLEFSAPLFRLGMIADFHAHKLWLSFLHNSGFTIKEIFMKNYSHLVQHLCGLSDDFIIGHGGGHEEHQPKVR